MFEVDLGLSDITPSLEPVELNDSASSNRDNDESIPQPDNDESFPLPDDDDSMFDDNEEQMWETRRCVEFLLKTCGCSKVNGNPCSSLFTVQHYTDLRAQASLLTHEQLDLVIMGSIMSTTNVTDDNIHGHHRPAKRQKTCIGYMHNGRQLCRKTYNFLHGVGKHRVPAIKNSYINDGLTPRVHGNSKATPHNALSFKHISNLVKFIQNYSEQNAILLPGRIPGYKRDDIKLLPSSESKKVKSKA